MPTNATIPTQSAADLCGMIVVDAGGQIVAANLSAYELFGNSKRSFAGAFLPNLLLTSDDALPEGLDGQWKAFKAATLDRWTLCRACRVGESSAEVRVRLERSFGGAGSFIATVRPVIAG